MGTRNLTIAVQDGQVRVAQYGQWDGYPTGQGQTVCEFIQKMDALDFKIKLAGLKEDTDEAAKARWAEFGINIEENGGMVDMRIADRYMEKYPQYNRDTGAGILDLISEEKVDTIRNDLSFAADSLFCEWAYLLDMDSGFLEIYKGFNNKPLQPEDRFYSLPLSEDRNKEYYQIVKVWEGTFEEIKAWPDIPQKMKELEKLISGDDE